MTKWRETYSWPALDAASFWQAHPWLVDQPFQPAFLLSYFAWQHVDLDVVLPQWRGEFQARFFCDSGAFSAHAAGVSLSWRTYAAWLKRYQHWFETMANLDVIDDPVATARHQQCLEDAGLPVLPVFHVGESWAILESLLSDYSYVGLGGMVPYSRARRAFLQQWLWQCFARCESLSTALHGFGCTSTRLLTSLCWATVDSTTWKSGAKYGRFALFDWRYERFVEYNTSASLPRRALLQLLRRFGYGLDHFHRDGYHASTAGHILGALSFTVLQHWLLYRYAHHCCVYLGVEPSQLWFFLPIVRLFQEKMCYAGGVAGERRSRLDRLALSITGGEP